MSRTPVNHSRSSAVGSASRLTPTFRVNDHHPLPPVGRPGGRPPMLAQTAPAPDPVPVPDIPSPPPPLRHAPAAAHRLMLSLSLPLAATGRVLSGQVNPKHNSRDVGWKDDMYGRRARVCGEWVGQTSSETYLSFFTILRIFRFLKRSQRWPLLGRAE